MAPVPQEAQIKQALEKFDAERNAKAHKAMETQWLAHVPGNAEFHTGIPVLNEFYKETLKGLPATLTDENKKAEAKLATDLEFVRLYRAYTAAGGDVTKIPVDGNGAKKTDRDTAKRMSELKFTSDLPVFALMDKVIVRVKERHEEREVQRSAAVKAMRDNDLLVKLGSFNNGKGHRLEQEYHTFQKVYDFTYNNLQINSDGTLKTFRPLNDTQAQQLKILQGIEVDGKTLPVLLDTITKEALELHERRKKPPAELPENLSGNMDNALQQFQLGKATPSGHNTMRVAKTSEPGYVQGA